MPLIRVGRQALQRRHQYKIPCRGKMYGVFGHVFQLFLQRRSLFQDMGWNEHNRGCRFML